MILENRETLLCGEPPARRDLILNRLLALEG
jgi:hypothetical protein